MHMHKVASNPSGNSGSPSLPPTEHIHVHPAAGADRFTVTLTVLTPDPSGGDSPVQGHMG